MAAIMLVGALPGFGANFAPPSGVQGSPVNNSKRESIPEVPEPATLLLFGSGMLAGAAALRRRLNSKP